MMNAVNSETPPPRTATRAPVDKPVKLQFDDSMDVVEGRCRNISIGGMFITVDESRPQGSLVRFELVIDETTSIRGLGEVIWMQPTGMGLKFRFLEQQDRQLIFKLVSRHIKERLANRRPGRGDDLLVDDDPSPVAPPVLAPAPPPPAAPAPAFQPPLPDPDAPFDAPLGDVREIAASSSSVSSSEPAGLSLDESILSMPGDETLATLGVELPERAPEPSVSRAFDEDPPDHPVYPEEGPRASSFEAGAYSSGPRARPRREIPVLPIAAVVLIVGAALIYFFWDQLFGSAPASPVSTPAAQAAAPPPPAEDPNTEPAGDPAAQTTPAQQASPPPAQTAPPPAQTAPRRASPPPPAKNASGTFTKIVDIRWKERSSGRVSVILQGDGTIPQGRLRRSRLDGESKPRILLRLSGVTERYGRSEIAVGHDTLLGIRTGYHKGDELHIVLDLPSPSVHVSNVRHQAHVLELILERR